MAISFRGVSNAAGQASGSAGASTVSLTPTLPGSAAAGDRIYVYAVGTTTSGTTPTSWNVVGTKDTTLGSGAAAAGTGLRRATWYWRDYDGVWTMPAFTLTSTANNSHWVGAVAITPTAGSVFNTPTITTVGGAFNAATTSYTDSSAASFTTHSSGFLLVGTGLNDNAATSAAAVTQTGATFGTVTERCDGGTSTGFTVAGKIHTCSVTTGASATITHTETIASSQGETLFVEQTETAPPPNDPISDLVDDFNTGSTPDAAKWSAASGSPALTGGRLVLAPGDTLYSVDVFDLTGSNIYAQAHGVSAGGLFLVEDTFGWQFNSSSQAEVVASGAPSGVTRTHTSGDWYRIREASGTIFYDYSASGSSWTNLHSEAVPIDITGLQAGSLASTGGGSNTFDNVNTTPITAATGTIASALQKVLFSGTGSHGQTGTIASSLQKAIFAGTGSQAQSGSISALLTAATMSASADQSQIGTVLALLLAASMSAAGNQPFSGTVSAQAQKATFAGSGAQEQSGYISASSQKLTMSAAGEHGQSGSIAAVLRPATMAASASSEPEGAISSTLQKALASLTGVQTQTGSIQSALQRAVMTSSGVMLPGGNISSTLPKALFSGSGSQLQAGSIAAEVQKALLSAVADQLVTGSIASQLQPAEAEFLGSMTPEGIVAAVLQRALMSTGTGFHSQAGQVAAVAASLDFAAAGLSKFFNQTPAGRRNLIQSASRLNQILADIRSNSVSADPRLNAIQALLRLNDIQSEPRRNSGG